MRVDSGVMARHFGTFIGSHLFEIISLPPERMPQLAVGLVPLEPGAAFAGIQRLKFGTFCKCSSGGDLFSNTS